MNILVPKVKKSLINQMRLKTFCTASTKPPTSRVVQNDFFDHNFTNEFKFKDQNKKIPVFRVMDEEGNIEKEGFDNINPRKMKKIFKTMIQNREADKIFLSAQRQSRISFYMPSTGEEAMVIGSAAALNDNDWIFPQYREQGALMYRGFTLQQMANQMTGNRKDLGKGKQMPIHYGSRALNYVTVGSCLTTQVPQAAGTGYTYRINDEDRISCTYFGDGAASEGDFHAAMNFASTLQSQTLFFCRNNMYAISTPVDDQYRGDGIAARGHSYGMQTLRVDGNDIFAVYAATKKAREIIVNEKRPALIEAISYRVGDHSTSDFSQLYRTETEMEKWNALIKKLGDPITRFEKYLVKQGVVDEGFKEKVIEETVKETRNALASAIDEKLPPIDMLFEDVYDEKPTHLLDQERDLLEHLKEYGEHYNLDKFEKR